MSASRPSQGLPNLRLGLSGGTGGLGAGLSSLVNTMTACPPGHQVLGAGCHCAAVLAGPHLGFRPPLHQQGVSSHGLSLHHLQRLPGGFHLCLSLRLTEKGEGGRALLGDILDLSGEGGQDERAQVPSGPLSVSSGHLPSVEPSKSDGRWAIEPEVRESRSEAGYKGLGVCAEQGACQTTGAAVLRFLP